MRVNRTGYIILILSLLVMFYTSGQPFLIYIAVALLIFALMSCILLLLDASTIKTRLKIADSGQFGKNITYELDIGEKHRLFVTKNVFVNVEIYNKMFGSTSYKKIMFEVREGKNMCTADIMATECGEIVLKCKSVYVTDMMNLFKVRAESFKDESTIIYPKHMNINIELSDMLNGESMHDGEIQDRRGIDTSEIYDIREYKPGDDFRSIHWKLSGKMDRFFVREASEPSHYDVVIIPDFAHYNGDKKATIDELNTAVAITAGVTEQFVMKGVSFCAMIPSEYGLSELYVSDTDDYKKMLGQSMCYKILQQSGSGLDYFITEHKENDYTRLIIVSAGRYDKNLSGLEKQIGITIINAIQDADNMFIDADDNVVVVDIPVQQEDDRSYNILC